MKLLTNNQVVRIKELEETVAHLKEENLTKNINNFKLESEHKLSLQEELAKAHNENNLLQSKLEEAEKRSSDASISLQEELAKAHNENNLLQSKLEEAEKRFSDSSISLQEELAKAQNENNLLQSKLEELRKENQQSELERQKLHMTIAKSEDYIKTWKEKVVAAKSKDEEKIVTLLKELEERECVISECCQILESVCGQINHELLSEMSISEEKERKIAHRIELFRTELSSNIKILTNCLQHIQHNEPYNVKELDLKQLILKITNRAVQLSDVYEASKQENVKLIEEVKSMELNLKNSLDDRANLENEVEELHNTTVSKNDYETQLSIKKKLEERCELLRKEIKKYRESAEMNNAFNNTKATSREPENFHNSITDTNSTSRLKNSQHNIVDSKREDNFHNKLITQNKLAASNDNTFDSTTENLNANQQYDHSKLALQPLQFNTSESMFEQDMITLAAMQCQRDKEIRALNEQIRNLDKKNIELKKQVEYDNGVIIKLTHQLEEMKSQNRIQDSVEYMHNIILQYLCAKEEMRGKIIPAIATVLQFTPEEKTQVAKANPNCPHFR